ncbi:hypothetical protein ACX3YC_26795 [Pseudomonas mohnii]
MLMQNYVESFQIASQRTDALAGGMSNYPLKIDSGLTINIASVVAQIAKDFSEFLPHTDVLPGQCFRIARELSYILFDLGIRHTVTVGDIELVDGLYVGLNLEKFVLDVANGYRLEFVDGLPAGKPIEPHAWITLENGFVVDATVLASQHCKSSNPEEVLSFEDALYFTGKPNTRVIRHIPMLNGFVYYQKVLTARRNGDLQNYWQWYEDYALGMARLDLFRLAPSLSSR